MSSAYRKCSTCRDPIAHGASYFRCSVSTCNRKRMPLYFCSIACWDAHQAEARHRDAWAEQDVAPTEAEDAGARRAAAEKAKSTPTVRVVEPRGARGAVGREVLVVSSKLKDYVKRRSDMAVSDRALSVVSDHLRELCDDAAKRAGADGRKTLLDRDVRPAVSRRSASLGITDDDDEPDVVLVVTSRLKEYVRLSTAMNVSGAIVPILSGHLRHLAREAIRKAGADDRRTVLDRDFVAVLGARG